MANSPGQKLRKPYLGADVILSLSGVVVDRASRMAELSVYQCAAKVTAIGFDPVRQRETVDLVVFNPTGLEFRLGIPFAGDASVTDSWSWPEPVSEPSAFDEVMADIRLAAAAAKVTNRAPSTPRKEPRYWYPQCMCPQCEQAKRDGKPRFDPRLWD